MSRKLLIILSIIFVLLLLSVNGVYAQVTPSSFDRLPQVWPDDGMRLQPVLDVITPHIPLATRLAGGPVRVLAIVKWDNRGNGRWWLEIKQRLHIDLHAVYVDSQRQASGLTGGTPLAQSDVDWQARLLSALNREPEVIISDIQFERFGKALQKRLLDRIAAGTGYIGPMKGIDRDGYRHRPDLQRQIFASSVPFAGLRRLVADYVTAKKAAEQSFALYDKGGAGRMAEVWTYPRDNAPPAHSRLTYEWLPQMEREAWYSFLSKVVLWCARRPGANFSINWPEAAVNREAMPLSVTAKVETASESQSLQVTLWDTDGRERWRSDETAVQHGICRLRLPKMPAGEYFAVARLTQGAVVNGWSMGAIKVTSRVDISRVSLANRFLGLEDKAEVTIELSSQPKDEWVLVVEALDNFGRIVSRQEIPAARKVQAVVPTAGSLHLYNYVNVKLVDAGGDLLSENRASFIIRQPPLPTDQMRVMMWGTVSNDPRDSLFTWRAAREGVDALYHRSKRATHNLDWGEITARYNIRLALDAFIMNPRAHRVTPEGVRQPALMAPGNVGHVCAIMGNLATAFRPYSPFQYSLGDEQYYIAAGKDAGWEKPTREYLAEWAKRRYGNIAGVNQAWGTNYHSFSQVEPIRRVDAAAAAIAAAEPDYKPLCHWVDHQLSTEDMVAGYYAKVRKSVKEVDPDPGLGIPNTYTAWRPGIGFDFWKIAESLDWVGAYAERAQFDLFRSAGKKGGSVGIYSGAYTGFVMKPECMKMLPWWAVFHGVNAMYYWHEGGLIAPDLGPMYGYRGAEKNIQELKSGIAKMLFNAERQDDGIAVLYSPGSMHALAFITPLPAGTNPPPMDGRLVLSKTDPTTMIPPLPKSDAWNVAGYAASDAYMTVGSWKGLTTLLTDSGLNYNAIHESMLEDDFLKQGKTRLLVLPLTLRVTDKMAQAIREFVRAGGIVLADFSPGLFNDLMQPKEGGVLSDVFGVEFIGGISHKMVLESTYASAKGWKKLGVDKNSVQADSLWGEYLVREISLRGAIALGRSSSGTPLMTVNNYGKGKAILLNMLARDYLLVRSTAQELPLRHSASALLAWTGIEPAVRSNLLDNRRPMQATETIRYLDGQVEYVGMLRDSYFDNWMYPQLAEQRPMPVMIDFGREAHVYDVRNRTYRGYRRKIDDMIYPARAELYALLPYEVKRLECKLNYRPEQGRLNLRARLLTADGRPPERHVIRLEIIDPRGRYRREHARNYLAENGQLARSILLGLDPLPGEWRIELRDVASGVSKNAQFTVDRQ